MHQRGQRDLRMSGDFDLQRGGAVRAQPLRQPVGQARGLGLLGVLASSSFPASPSALPKPCRKRSSVRSVISASRNKPAMNHSFAAAVGGDDGTGRRAHVRGVAPQGFLHGLQFPGDLFAARFQRLGLVSSSAS